eukprot:15452074-Alexandrium_andersonii.AAC.1
MYSTAGVSRNELHDPPCCTVVQLETAAWRAQHQGVLIVLAQAGFNHSPCRRVPGTRALGSSE